MGANPLLFSCFFAFFPGCGKRLCPHLILPVLILHGHKQPADSVDAKVNIFNSLLYTRAFAMLMV